MALLYENHKFVAKPVDSVTRGDAAVLTNSNFKLFYIPAEYHQVDPLKKAIYLCVVHNGNLWAGRYTRKAATNSEVCVLNTVKITDSCEWVNKIMLDALLRE